VIRPRDEVRAVAAAEHGGRHGFAGAPATELLDFSVCLNAHGPAPSVVDAIRAAPVDEYPDPRSLDARNALARASDTPLSSIALGAGSAELIHAVCFAYLRPGDVALVAEPAFGEYRRAASLCGAHVVGIAIGADDDLLQPIHRAVERLRPRVVFVASPINPTGIANTRDALAALADSCHAVNSLLVLDQAYDAFAANPLGTPALRDQTNVLHLRSLTKQYALAGVRVAAGIGAERTIHDIEAVRTPWSASTAAQAAAIAVTSEDARRHARDSIACLRAERQRVATALASSGIVSGPSETHFMLIECPMATPLRDRLIAEHNILVRDCTSFGLKRHIRIAARLPHENDALIHGLLRTLT
jgi:histidinol-phosphate aminotransferase